jgi:hypothetical protein
VAAEPSKETEPGDKRSPFERFEDLTRRVVKVPKAEVDELRKKQEKRRRRTT